MTDNNALTNQYASSDLSTPNELEPESVPESELDLEEELEELVIEDFTIDGICGVY
ncbi:MAG TPA: mycofactocin precursor MftA [Ktedonobacteraceae bacterium]|nr:mycofactocin precursor MftA [Ktedonobacteraceae bacterium]